jgi:hypothetical protein
MGDAGIGFIILILLKFEPKNPSNIDVIDYTIDKRF